MTFRTITAKFAGICRRCGGAFEVGVQIRWAAGKGSLHLVGRCLEEDGEPDGSAQRQMDAEYARGQVDYKTWKFNTQVFGEEYAASEELARELRDPDPAY